MVEKILNNTTPYGKIRASHEGSLHSSTLIPNHDTSRLFFRIWGRAIYYVRTKVPYQHPIKSFHLHCLILAYLEAIRSEFKIANLIGSKLRNIRFMLENIVDIPNVP